MEKKTLPISFISLHLAAWRLPTMAKGEHHRKQYDVTSMYMIPESLDYWKPMSSLPRKVQDLPAKVIRWNAAVGILHSLMPKGRLRVWNSLWKSYVINDNGKLFTTGCRLPHKSTNFGTLLVAWLVWLLPTGCTGGSGGEGNPAMAPQSQGIIIIIIKTTKKFFF